MAAINEYEGYTPAALRSALGTINEGDSVELHNALIVVCGIIDTQAAQIRRLEKRLDEINEGHEAPLVHPEEMTGRALAEWLVRTTRNYPGGPHKINLIKALRRLRDCSLHDAKDKVEKLFDFSAGVNSEPVIKQRPS